MNEQEIKATREKYKELDNKRQQIVKSRKRLYELDQDPLIKEYLELKKFIEEVQMGKYSAYNICEHIFSKIISNTENSNNVYVYIGRDANSRIAKIYYHIYKDLETGQEIMILESQREQFERSNKVIYKFPKTEIHSKETWLKWYNEIRRLFLSHIIKKPQEQAVKKLMHKYSKNYR